MQGIFWATRPFMLLDWVTCLLNRMIINENISLTAIPYSTAIANLTTMTKHIRCIASTITHNIAIMWTNKICVRYIDII